MIKAAFFLAAATRRDSTPTVFTALLGVTTNGTSCSAEGVAVVTYAHYACVADCADAMADAWEDTARCAPAICLHENLLQ